MWTVVGYYVCTTRIRSIVISLAALCCRRWRGLLSLGEAQCLFVAQFYYFTTSERMMRHAGFVVIYCERCSVDTLPIACDDGNAMDYHYCNADIPANREPAQHSIALSSFAVAGVLCDTLVAFSCCRCLFVCRLRRQ